MSKDLSGLLASVLAGGVTGFAEGRLSEIKEETDLIRKEGLLALEREYDLDVAERENTLALKRLDIENTNQNTRQGLADQREDLRGDKRDKAAMDRLEYETTHRAAAQPSSDVQLLRELQNQYGKVKGTKLFTELKASSGSSGDLTEKQRADLELKINEEAYRNVMGNSTFEPNEAQRAQIETEKESLRSQVLKDRTEKTGYKPTGRTDVDTGLIKDVMQPTSSDPVGDKMKAAGVKPAAAAEPAAAPSAPRSETYDVLLNRYVHEAKSDKDRQAIINEAGKTLPPGEKKRFAADAKTAYEAALAIDARFGGVATAPEPSAQPAPIGQPQNMDQVLGKSAESTRSGLSKFLQNGISLGDIIGYATRGGVAGVKGGYDLAGSLFDSGEED